MLRFDCHKYLDTLKKRGYKRVKTVLEWLKNPEETYYLKYDGRACGYKFNDELRFFSYNTLVCMFELDSRLFVNYGQYSKTTNKHQWDFIDSICEHYGYFNVKRSNGFEYYRPIFEDEQYKSGSEFLQNVVIIDFKNKTYCLDKSLRRLDYPTCFLSCVQFWRI